MKIILLPLRSRDCITGIPFKQLAGTYRMMLLLKSATLNSERYELLGIACTRLCEPMKYSSDSNSLTYWRGNKGISLLLIFKLCCFFMCDKVGNLWILFRSSRNLVRSDKVTICPRGINEIEFPIMDRLFNLDWLLKYGNVTNLKKSSFKFCPENFSLAGSSSNTPLSSVFVRQRAKNYPTMTKISRDQDTRNISVCTKSEASIWFLRSWMQINDFDLFLAVK